MPRPSTRPARDRIVAATAGAAAVAALWFGPTLTRSVTGPPAIPETPQAASVTQPLVTGPDGAATGPLTGPLPAAREPGAGPGAGGTGTATGPAATTGPPVPAVVFDAYRRAESALAGRAAGCRLTWPVLAAIGQVESSHARGGRVDASGRTLTPILGPVLDGSGGTAALSDSEQGRMDGDAGWDRAVGPMQFIPTTWTTAGADGNGDGVADPHNVNDAALAAGGYLCSAGDDLATPEGRLRAVLRYNHSDAYARLVLSLAARYAGAAPPVVDGVVPVPETVRVLGGTSPGTVAPVTPAEAALLAAPPVGATGGATGPAAAAAGVPGAGTPAPVPGIPAAPATPTAPATTTPAPVTPAPTTPAPPTSTPPATAPSATTPATAPATTPATTPATAGPATPATAPAASTPVTTAPVATRAPAPATGAELPPCTPDGPPPPRCVPPAPAP